VPVYEVMIYMEYALTNAYFGSILAFQRRELPFEWFQNHQLAPDNSSKQETVVLHPVSSFL
jgi:hypothetical protein